MVLYNFIVRLYGFIIRNAAIRNLKAKQWVTGRKDWRIKFREETGRLRPGSRIWVHCASYGEFEQGRPIIEAIRKDHPDYVIILSFFSPSGFEPFKQWPGCDMVCYLPLDTPKNAKDFVALIDPKVAIFIKYEFWINVLFELKKRSVPTYLVSATFKSHHPFFRRYGKIFRRSLQAFKVLMVQEENSGKLLETIGITNYLVTGDTRFDRVIEIRKNAGGIDGLNGFVRNDKIIVAGSTWGGDEELVLDAYRMLPPGVKLIIAPHNLDKHTIAQLEERLKKRNIGYCLFTENIDASKSVMILNTMGILSRVYRYAHCAYIGGGFDGGLHNTLEAAVYGIPVAFYGEGYVKYNEAVDLVNMNAGALVNDPTGLKKIFEKFLFDAEYAMMSKTNLEKYFEKNANVTAKVMAAMDF
jgi:3-deoxy-D-manno-octulosonic-acid transferase